MRVLFVHNDYGRFSGEERAAEQLARLATAYGDHEVLWWRRSSAELAGRPARQAAALFTGIYNPAARREMGRVLHRERIDLVQVQNVYPLFSPSILVACTEQGIPVVMRCPNYRLFCPTGLHLSGGAVCERCVGGHEWQALRHRCAGDALKSAAYAIRNAYARQLGLFTNNVSVFAVLSEFQRRLFVARGVPAERLAYLPNVAPLAADIKGEGTTVGASYVAFCGRWSPEKGTAEFAEAARRLPAIRFKVAGATRAEARLAGEPPANIEFAGQLGGDDLRRFYRDSRLVVVPSKWYEGFPNVILEAMAAARPVIGTRIGAIPEIVEDRVTGRLAEPGDGADLAARIDELWHDPEALRTLGAAGRAKAEDLYSETQVARWLEAAYVQARRSMAGAAHSSGGNDGSPANRVRRA